ncbi:MAG: hypothetical protein WA268_01535 [Xanthobacteraceae bacterium]
MDLVSEIAQRKASWTEMVPSAAVSRHPYGFLVVRLPAKVSEADVRFNVWLKENRPGQQPNWPIHSHEVSMSSYVVRGELENLVWPEPRFGFGEPLYLASYSKSTSVLTKSDLRISEGRKVCETVRAGTQYEVAKGLFHATNIPDDAECVTLCMFHAEENGIGTVLGSDGHPQQIEFQRFAVTPETAQATKELLLSALS